MLSNPLFHCSRHSCRIERHQNYNSFTFSTSIQHPHRIDDDPHLKVSAAIYTRNSSATANASRNTAARRAELGLVVVAEGIIPTRDDFHSVSDSPIGWWFASVFSGHGRRCRSGCTRYLTQSRRSGRLRGRLCWFSRRWFGGRQSWFWGRGANRSKRLIDTS